MGKHSQHTTSVRTIEFDGQKWERDGWNGDTFNDILLTYRENVLRGTLIIEEVAYSSPDYNITVGEARTGDPLTIRVPSPGLWTVWRKA